MGFEPQTFGMAGSHATTEPPGLQLVDVFNWPKVTEKRIMHSNESSYMKRNVGILINAGAKKAFEHFNVILINLCLYLYLGRKASSALSWKNV